MFFYPKRTRSLLLLFLLICNPFGVFARGFFENIEIQTSNQAKATLLALAATSACALYCGYVARNIVIEQQREHAANEDHDRSYRVANFLVEFFNHFFGRHLQNPGNVGNPPQSFSFAPYVWATASGLALLRSGVLAHSLYSYYHRLLIL
jgi:hypothetical protein